MGRIAAWAGRALTLLGIALIVASIVVGDTHVYLVVIIPVLTGTSVGFLAGIGCFLLGLIVWALSDVELEVDEALPREPGRPGSASRSVSGGGLVLIGPVPIFFGGARRLEGRYFWLAVAVGAVLVVGALAAVYFL